MSKHENIVDRFQTKVALYTLEWTQCGKKNCRSCPHGPYWYAQFTSRKTGRTIYKYIGKQFHLLTFDRGYRKDSRRLTPLEKEIIKDYEDGRVRITEKTLKI